MKRPLLLLAAGLSLLLANCTLSTPQARIEHNEALFSSLSLKDQRLVQRGEIAKGMSKQAVYLAFGDPHRVVKGHKGDRPFERWDYTRLRARYVHRYHGFFGRGCRGHGYGFGLSPSIQYVPYRSASVIFHDGSVSSWEQLGLVR